MTQLLPFDKGRIKSIAVIGPDAYPAQPVGGGSAEVRPFAAVSFLEGVANYLGRGAKVYYEPGIPTLEELAAQTRFTTEANGGQAGLKAEFFNNANLTGEPGIQRVDKKASYDPGAAEECPRTTPRFAGRDTSRPALRATTWPSFKAREKMAVTGCMWTRNW